MSSYRVTLTIGVLRPGVEPSTVLPAAAEAARRRTEVEAYDVAVVRGEARVTVRFTSDDDEDALAIARRVRATVATLADVTDASVRRRYGSRWHPLDIRATWR